nr:hypothetical protein [Candidatus Korarchaeota archaeon]
QSPVPVVNWSPQKKAVYAMGMYTKLYNNYLHRIALAVGLTVEEVKVMMMTEEGQTQLKAMIDASSLNEYQRQVLRTRKKFLVGAEKAIQSYNFYIGLGEMPPAETEEALLNLIDQFEMMTVQ